MILVGLVVVAVGVLLAFVGRRFGRMARDAAASPSGEDHDLARAYATQRTLLYVVAGSAVALGLLTLLAA